MKEYFIASARRTYSFVFALMLLAMYELFILLFVDTDKAHVQNLIGAMFRELTGVVPYFQPALGALLLGLGVWYVYQDKKEGREFQPNMLVAMWVESLMWAILVLLLLPMFISHYLGMQTGPQGSWFMNMGLSLGAGFYEELFFRLILLQGLIWFTALMGYPSSGVPLKLLLVVVTAVLFSLAHHLGDEPFTVRAFVYRTVFGLMMNGLLVLRGFGITSWTHALYDVMVFSIQALQN